MSLWSYACLREMLYEMMVFSWPILYAEVVQINTIIHITKILITTIIPHAVFSAFKPSG